MAGKYWIGNEPNSSVTSEQAQKIAAAPEASIGDVVDALDGATFTGHTVTTSGTPTVEELEACIGVLAGKVNKMLLALKSHGIILE